MVHVHLSARACIEAAHKVCASASRLTSKPLVASLKAGNMGSKTSILLIRAARGRTKLGKVSRAIVSPSQSDFELRG